MSKELQQKLKGLDRQNPLDEVIKKLLQSSAKSCVRAKIKLLELEDKDNEKETQ